MQKQEHANAFEISYCSTVHKKTLPRIKSTTVYNFFCIPWAPNVQKKIQHRILLTSIHKILHHILYIYKTLCVLYVFWLIVCKLMGGFCAQNNLAQNKINTAFSIVIFSCSQLFYALVLFSLHQIVT